MSKYLTFKNIVIGVIILFVIYKFVIAPKKQAKNSTTAPAATK